MIKNENFIVIQGFMVNELKLKGNELMVYAIIYGFSQEENSWFSGSRKYLSEWTNITTRNIQNILNSLVENKLIEKKTNNINGVIFCEYKALMPSQSFTLPVKKVHHPSENISPNNIEDNIDNIKENNIKEKKKFSKPTIEEIEQYCKERKNNIDANVFYDFYESKGWVVGKSSMKDWKACVRTWERSSIQNGTFKSKKEQKVTLPDWYDQYTKELDERLEKEQQDLKKDVEELGDDWADVMKELFGEKNE